VQPVAVCTARSAGTPLLPSRGARLRLRARECGLAVRSPSHPSQNRRRNEGQDRSPGGAQTLGIGDPAPGCPRRSGLTKKVVRGRAARLIERRAERSHPAGGRWGRRLTGHAAGDARRGRRASDTRLDGWTILDTAEVETAESIEGTTAEVPTGHGRHDGGDLSLLRGVSVAGTGGLAAGYDSGLSRPWYEAGPRPKGHLRGLKWPHGRQLRRV
jgi:hypothetical protein